MLLPGTEAWKAKVEGRRGGEEAGGGRRKVEGQGTAGPDHGPGDLRVLSRINPEGDDHVSNLVQN